jgi:CDP-glycerol glycerophosphotransferase
MKIIVQIFQLIFLCASYIVPRNKKLIVYADNSLNSSIYLFRYASALNDGYSHVYITPYEDVFSKLRRDGFKVAKRWSVYGAYLAFRAQTYVISSSKGQINNPLSRHAYLINLWHGISVKKIGLMTYHSKEKLHRKMEEFSAFKMVPSTSPLTQKCFMEAFGKSASETPILGEPRNDFLIKNKIKRNTDFLNYYLDVEADSYSKVIGYLPTWRDYGRWDDGIDYTQLNTTMASSNNLLIIKPHPKDITFDHLGAMSNIKVVKPKDGWQDAYEILVGLDVLITDYSSLAYEYILLERPIILYTPDYERFSQDREFWLDYEEIAPAKRICSFDELQGELEIAVNGVTLTPKYRESLEKLHTIRDGSSCEKIYKRIKAILR